MCRCYELFARWIESIISIHSLCDCQICRDFFKEKQITKCTHCTAWENYDDLFFSPRCLYFIASPLLFFVCWFWLWYCTFYGSKLVILFNDNRKLKWNYTNKIENCWERIRWDEKRNSWKGGMMNLYFLNLINLIWKHTCVCIFLSTVFRFSTSNKIKQFANNCTSLTNNKKQM